MSISSLQNSIKRSKQKIIDYRKKLSVEQEKESKARTEKLKTQKSITKNTSASMLKSKLTKIGKLDKTVGDAVKEQGILNKKISDEDKKLHGYTEQLLRAEQRELKKAESQRKRNEQEQQRAQAILLKELNQYKKALTEHTYTLENEKDEEVYDIFISHASDDKDDFVRPLAEYLSNEDISIWYDEQKLTWGKPTRRTIDKGLSNCRFGIVVFSEAFFRKGWTNYELDGLVARYNSEGGELILPIWHNVGYEEVKKFSPPLADITALDSSKMSIEEIAEQLTILLKEASGYEVEL
ncbi:toll/interleukin-1 receptor domain-containing protein [Pseudobacillus badius]|uniref:toll/interleukin-1 receptor domain-containing protein n=1 Tax=Bacillus badius TaxID=1455 RepID=UPI00249FE564|nr:toll/interleukin-1 receptor domain-containing protein [Bacillus badius]GLY10374.1 hypothetical protein Bbad01_15900 [Bacillus badius]